VRTESATASSVCALGLDARHVRVDLGVARGGIPAQDVGDDFGDDARAGDAPVRVLDRDAGAPGEDVLQVQRPLVRDRVADLCHEVVRSRRHGLEQLRGREA